MSRKSDIEKAEQLLWDDEFKTYRALEVAYDLGRAAQAEKDAPKMGFFTETDKAKDTAKRLRAKVQKMVEGK